MTQASQKNALNLVVQNINIKKQLAVLIKNPKSFCLTFRVLFSLLYKSLALVRNRCPNPTLRTPITNRRKCKPVSIEGFLHCGVQSKWWLLFRNTPN